MLLEAKSDYSSLDNIMFYLFIFSVPFLAVSPWQTFFSVPVGYIYVGLVVINILLLLYRYNIYNLINKTNNVPFFWLLTIFLFINVVSVLFNLPSHGWSKDTLVELGYRFFSVIVYVLVVINTSKSNYKIIIYVYLAASVIAALIGLYVTLGYMAGLNTGQPVTYIVPRLFGTATEPQVFGNFLLSCLPISIGLLLLKIDIKIHFISLVVFILLLATVMTISVGAWAGLLGSVLVILFFIRNFSIKSVIAFIIVVLMTAGSVVSIDRFLEPNYSLGLKSAVEVKILGNINKKNSGETTKSSQSVDLNARSYFERAWFRQAAWNMVKEHPFLGVGTGNYGSLYNQYRQAGTPALDFKVKAHNQYLKILSENGLVGFGIYLAIITALLIKSLRNYFNANYSQKILIVCLLASLVGIGIHGYSFGFMRHNYTWILLAVLVSLTNHVDYNLYIWGKES